MYKIFLLLYFLILINYALPVLTPQQLREKYCAHKCADGNLQAVCRKQGKCAASDPDACSALEMTEDLRILILAFHNEKRNEIATGVDKRGFNKAAANMNALSYDKELEFLGQCWVNECTFVHDKCRHLPKYKTYIGQNLGKQTGKPLFVNNELTKKGLVAWFEEITKGKQEILKKFKLIHSYGHFTQLVWAKAKNIGCAHALQNGSQYDLMTYFLICNYDTGNVIGKSVYLFGEPCSKCEDGRKCSKEYDGLCGEDKFDRGEELLPYHDFDIDDKFIIPLIESVNDNSPYDGDAVSSGDFVKGEGLKWGILAGCLLYL